MSNDNIVSSLISNEELISLILLPLCQEEAPTASPPLYSAHKFLLEAIHYFCLNPLSSCQTTARLRSWMAVAFLQRLRSSFSPSFFPPPKKRGKIPFSALPLRLEIRFFYRPYRVIRGRLQPYKMYWKYPSLLTSMPLSFLKLWTTFLDVTCVGR